MTLEAVVQEQLSRAVATGDLELPLLPHVVAEILNQLGDEGGNARALSDMIHQDQALAAHVLRIANSPAYMGRTSIVSLQQAVVRLGTRTLSEITMLISVKGSFYKSKQHEDWIAHLWRQAYAAGLFGKEIARAKKKNVERGFLCGLLHAIGKPVVLQAAIRIAEQESVTIHRTDLAHIVDHFYVPVGARVAELWHLPAQVRAAISHHLNPPAAREYRFDAMLTSLSAFLGNWVLRGDPPEAATNHPAFMALNLYRSDVERILERGETIREHLNGMP